MLLVVFRRFASVATAVSLAAMALFLVFVVTHNGPALASSSTIRYVARTGDDSGNDCTTSNAPCATVQHAVDVAGTGDEIRVASGTYTATGSNVVSITKSITITGGFEPPDWSTSVSSSTTRIDGEKARRGIWVQGIVHVTIANLTVTRGRTGDGGGLYLLKGLGRVDIRNSKFEDNESFATWLYGGGGAIQALGHVTLRNTDIISNFARKLGGGLFLRNRATLIGTRVLSNTTYQMGGGLYSIERLTVTDSEFRNNVTLFGAIPVRGGGGLWVEKHTVLSGTQVVGNISARDGGGLYLKNDVLTMTNVIIADNHADWAGSGLYSVDSSSSRLVHTTIARNLGDAGSGIHIAGPTSTIAMTNTILVSHTVGITVAASNTATLNGVLWYSNTTNYGGEGTINHSNDYTGDPAFVAPDAGDYHISSGSAARDTGVDTDVHTDIDGEVRPFGSKPDLGADELAVTLSIGKVGPAAALADELITYTLTITNSGVISGSGVVITDALPSGAHYVSGGTLMPGNVVSWTVASLAGNDNTQVQFVITATQTITTQTITNSNYSVSCAEGISAIGTEAVVTKIEYEAYLPLVVRQFP